MSQLLYIFKFNKSKNILSIECNKSLSIPKVSKIEKYYGKKNHNFDDYTLKKVIIDESDINKLMNNFQIQSNQYFIFTLRYERDNEKRTKRYYLYKDGKELLQRSKFPRKHTGFVKPLDDCIFRKNTMKVENNYFLELFQFFVINLPENFNENKKFSSAQYFNVKKVHGEKCWNNTTGNLKYKLKSVINSDFIFHHDSENDIKLSSDKLFGNLESGFPNQEAFVIVNNQRNIFLSVFRHIRNGIAHGRFVVHNANGYEFLFLEDKNRGKVTARINVKINTLIKWKNILESNT